MELTYDRKHNVAYLRLKSRRTDDADWHVETVNVSDDLNVDVGPDGTVHGIELLNANEQLGSVAEVVIAAGSSEERREALSLT